MESQDRPHVTPSDLFPGKRLPGKWADAKVGLICFTPFPAGLARYVKHVSPERYFIHSPPSEVRFCEHGSVPFVVLGEVYGFAVGATTVEELVAYGVDTIIGVGFVGSLRGLPIGQTVIASSTVSDLPLAAHYGVDAHEAVEPDHRLTEVIATALGNNNATLEYGRIWNSNSLYREYSALVDKMKALGCDAVNMDTLSVFAVANVCAKEARRPIHCAYIATVTDSSGANEWESDLMGTINGTNGEPHDTLVRTLVEDAIPNWLNERG